MTIHQLIGGMVEKPAPTVEDVARWMRDEFVKAGYLEQADAVAKIEAHFGAAFVYDNDRGNPAISRKFLAAFRRATESDSIIWDREDKGWRRRLRGDPPGRRSEL
jgi:hypothetical protein